MSDLHLLKFPPNLKMGFSSASYQIEGAWNADGKGENIWDRFSKSPSSRIVDGSSGDVAADSYKHYKQDVALIKMMGGQVYRFSISWSRLLPDGFSSTVNPAGVDYYNKLINELIANGIEPMITLYHWDLPQPLQDIGGWPNECLADYFVNYARIVFSLFGDRVKRWTTFNEPWEICYLSCGLGVFAPGLPGHGVGEYLAAHTILKAHARTYHLYHNEFRSKQEGVVGISLNTSGCLPKTDSPEDIAAAKRYFDFQIGWFAHPIFSLEGDYPQSMKLAISANSEKELFPKSRLPQFDDYWVSYIRGTADFYGLNHYTSQLVSARTEPFDTKIKPSWEKDVGVDTSQDSSWPTTASSWFRVMPQGLRKMLTLVKEEYNNPVVYITENGYSDKGTLEDDGRIAFYNDYLKEMLKAIYIDGVNVELYTAWSLLDDFEWMSGYTENFGIIHVDFTDPDRKRTPKKAAGYFKKIIQNRSIDP